MVDLGTRPLSPGPASPSPSTGSNGIVPPRSGPRWGLTAMLWFTLVASLASLGPLFQGSGWLLGSAFVSALMLGFMAAARAVRWPAAGVFVVGLLVAVMACTVTVSGGTAILGVIPTAETVERVRLLLQQAGETIVAGQAPVVVSTGILAIVISSVAVASLVVDVLARPARVPVLTGVVFAVVLVVPSLVPDTEPSWAWVVLTVLGYVGVLVVSTGRRPSRTSIVTGVAALAVAGVVTSVIPLSLTPALSGVGTGTGISTGVNPAINLGDDLRRGTAVNVLSYSTTSSEGEYLKLVDLVDFSGTRWSPKAVTLDGSNSVASLPAAPGIAKSTRRSTETTRVSVSLLRSPYLPIPVPATKISGIDDRWKYVDASGVTVRSTSEGSQGLDYSVVSKPVNPTRAQIVRSLAKTPADLSDYTSVAGVPKSITRLAARVTAGAANPFDAAVDIQDFFRDGDFTYSESTPVADGYDGTGLDAITVFLKRKSGYCVHFASAMAVMARTLGIPSRIAVGFLPGTQQGTSDTWDVTSNDLHTWPELYFQGLGWVPFEPTVGQGTTSSYLQQTNASASPSASATAEPSDSATAEPTASAAPTTSVAPTSSAEPSSTAATGSASSAGSPPLLVTGILVLLVLALLPWWLRTSRRRRRLGAGPPDAALSAWHEVIDTARDLGLPVDGAATPTATATVLRGVLERASGSPASAALAALVVALEAERFGDEPAPRSVHDSARQVISGLRGASSPASRLRAAFAPRSLVGDMRVRPAR